MKQPPFYAWYATDYLRDTAHLSKMEDLAYRRLLDWSWYEDKPLPTTMPLLGDCIRFTAAEMRAVWPKLKRFWPRGRNVRLEKERSAAHTRMQ